MLHMLSVSFCITEYASNGSLYAYLQNPENRLDFEQILKWGKEIALGKCAYRHELIWASLYMQWCSNGFKFRWHFKKIIKKQSYIKLNVV